MRARYGWILLSAVALFCCRAVSADSFVSIGTGVGTACQLGCTGDPNLIGTGTNFDLARVSGDGLVAVILAVPNDSNFIGSITMQGGTGGFVGFDSSTDIYTFLAQNHLGQDFDHYVVPNGVLSDTLLNLETADSRIDSITSSGYGIYLFEVGGGNPPSGFVSVNAMNIPLGSFVFGLGEKAGELMTPPEFDGTPFSEAGLTTTGAITAVPEPDSLVLFGSGLVSMAAILRRRFMRS